MATLTDAQCTWYRQMLHKSKGLLKAESPVLTHAQIKAAFQAIEDFWENNRTTLKSDIDTAVGQTISNALAKKMGKWWLKSKWGGE